MAELGTVVALIKSMSGADPAVIEQAVQDWLDDHPEATTTVQDGSITEAKLAQDVLAELGEIDELKEAIADIQSTVKVDYEKSSARIKAPATSNIISIMPYKEGGYSTVNLAHTKDNLITSPYVSTGTDVGGLKYNTVAQDNVLNISGVKSISYGYRYYLASSILEQEEKMVFCGVTNYKVASGTPNFTLDVAKKGTTSSIYYAQVSTYPIIEITPESTADGIDVSVFTYGTWSASADIHPLLGHGEKLTKALGSTIYGGSYNWNTGELVSLYASDGTPLAEPVSTNIGSVQISEYSENWYYSDTGYVSFEDAISATDALKKEVTASYSTLSDLRKQNDLVDGTCVTTTGYYYSNDGGGAKYKIRRKLTGEFDNGGSKIVIGDLVAELIADNSGLVDVRKFGARGDGGTDDTNAFLNAIYYFKGVYVPEGIYCLSSEVTIGENRSVEMHQNAVIRPTGNNGLIIMRNHSSLCGGTIETYLVGNSYDSSAILVKNNVATDLYGATIRNVNLRGSKGNGVGIEFDSSVSTVLGCTVDNVNSYGYKIAVKFSGEQFAVGNINIWMMSNYAWCVAKGSIGGSRMYFCGEAGDSNAYSDYALDLNAISCEIFNCIADVGNQGHIPYQMRLDSGSHENIITGIVNNKTTTYDYGFDNYYPTLFMYSKARTGAQIKDNIFNNVLSCVGSRYTKTVTLDNCTVEEINHNTVYSDDVFLESISAVNPVDCWKFEATDDTQPASVQIDIQDIYILPTAFTYEWAKYIGLGSGVSFDHIELFGRENNESEYVLLGEHIYDREIATVTHVEEGVFSWRQNDNYNINRNLRYKDIRIVLSFEKTETYTGVATITALSIVGVYDDQHMAFIQTKGDTMYGDLTFDNGKSVIIESQNGTKYRLTVANDGTLGTSAIV